MLKLVSNTAEAVTIELTPDELKAIKYAVMGRMIDLKMEGKDEKAEKYEHLLNNIFDLNVK